MIDLEVTLFYIPLSGFRVCNLYNRAEVRPSQIVNTRVHNLQIIETQIKLAKVIQISLAERIAVFRHQLFCGPLKMRRVPQKGVFVHRISLPYQKSLFFTPSASENASRTTGVCFAHRVSPKTPPVHQEPFFRTECIFRTPEATLLYRMPTPKRRKGPGRTKRAESG